MAAEKARVVICLFRNDLRYHDNQMLHWAHANGERILPLFCLDPVSLGRTWNFGFPKTGRHRLCFLLEAITDLRQKLKQHGSNLVVREGETADVIRDLVTSLGTDNVQAVTFQKEVTKEEVDVEAAIKSDCKKCGIKVRTFWGLTLYHKEDLPFDPQQTPNVYTEFRKAVENRSSVRQMKEMPEQLKPFPEDIDEGAIPAYPDQAAPPGDHDSRSAFPFSGGETSALGRLHYYLWESDKVERYKETRNGMIGPDYSTKFSPWLALGNLSPLKIYWEMKKYESERTANQSTYWVIFELLWRDYFKFVALKFGTRLFYKSGLLGKSIPWKIDMAMFHAWKDGRTGVPYVDANMRELKTTGFMSNRGRQNVASYLTKDLKLDWRLGAEWFESMLIDHDVCSNYGNWLYSAGIGNDPRQDRKFNMIKQGLDYDPNGDYVRLWVPELSAVKSGDVHRVWTLSQSQLSQAGVSIGETYPHPIVVAPEWGRHFSKSRGAGGRGGKGCDPAPTRRGVDFYFSSKPHNNQQ